MRPRPASTRRAARTITDGRRFRLRNLYAAPMVPSFPTVVDSQQALSGRVLDKLITERMMRYGHIILFLARCRVDFTYVENVVWGHFLLEKQLWEEPQRVGGESFCISNGDPWVAADLFFALAHFWKQATGQQMPVYSVPEWPIFLLARCVELFQLLTRCRVPGDLGMLTPAMLSVATLSYSFSCKKAQEMLHYEPIYSLDEGLQKTVSCFLSSK